MLLKRDQSKVCKINGEFQILFYIVRQRKPNLTKVSKENIWVYRLEAGGLVDRVMFI